MRKPIAKIAVSLICFLTLTTILPRALAQNDPAAEIVDYIAPAGTLHVGEVVTFLLTVENTGEMDWTFWVDCLLTGPGDSLYTGVNLFRLGPANALIPKGALQGFSLDWQIPENIHAGTYQWTLRVWDENPLTGASQVAYETDVTFMIDKGISYVESQYVSVLGFQKIAIHIHISAIDMEASGTDTYTKLWFLLKLANFFVPGGGETAWIEAVSKVWSAIDIGSFYYGMYKNADGSTDILALQTIGNLVFMYHASLLDLGTLVIPITLTIIPTDFTDAQVPYYWELTFNTFAYVADAIVVNRPTLAGISFTGDQRAICVFNSPVGFLSPTEGESFVMISTGVAANIPGSPGQFESTDFDGGGTAGDTASLTLELVVPAGATTLSFDFRFMSEEYPEWVGTAYNDFFYAYLTDSTGTHQVAYDDNGNIINVNNNFFNPNIYPIGTVFDGSTKRLTTTVDVNAGESITLRLVVGDVGDGIYDTGVFVDNVRFNVGPTPPGTTPTADVIVVKNGPNTAEQGKQFTYTLNYFNIEEGSAENVVVMDTLPSEVSFVSASSGGVYSSPTHSVSWNLGTLAPFSSGSLTLSVSIPSGTSIGTVLENTASISTTSQESDSQNNDYPKSTTVTGGASLPPNVEVGPTVSNYNGIPVLYWTTPTTFTYHGDTNVIGVDINIHLPDGGLDIAGSMINTPGTYDWAFTYTFYPRHGQGTVTYTVHYADGSQDATAHNILVDPSGYVYNAITGERIEGATVTLFRFETVLMQFVIVPPSDSGIDPHINPQITDENGGYGWMVSPGMYMVRVEKEGYGTNFAIVTVPPAATDLNVPLTPIDTTPPNTEILIGTPHYIDSLGNTYVTSDTSFTLTADDGPDGSGVDASYYRHYNLTYDSDWTGYSDPFYLEELEDGPYSIDYYSTDVVGNVEPTNTKDVILDNTGPEITISNPPAGWALQDGVTFLGAITDAGCGVFSMSFSIREANGDEGIPIGFEDLLASYDPNTGEWSFFFDTLLVPDGYYVLFIEAEDNLGNEASTVVPYSIRNWAVIELLPSSTNNKAGRTMPVKFALRVAAEVDPDQTFVYNEELRIEIYATNNPTEILQESYFGDIFRDYRISSVLYITNFKALRTPMEYTVAIYRDSFDVGSFTFETTK